MTIADKTFTAPWDIFPQAATGQELGHAANLWDLFTREVTFGGGSTANVITVPDNVASGLELVDAGGIEYMRVDTQNAQPQVHWNQAGADIDYRWESVGVDPALFIRGSDGHVGIGTAAPADVLHVASGHILGPDGTEALPGYSFASQNTTGFYWTAANGGSIFLNITTVARISFYSNAVRMRNTEILGWASGSPVTTGIDVALYRNAADVVEINNGTPGTIRDLRVRALNPGGERLGVGITAPLGLFHAEVSDAATNTVSFSEYYSHITSGVAAAGFGVGTQHRLEDAAGARQIAAWLATYWTNPAAANYSSVHEISVASNTLETEMVRFDGIDTQPITTFNLGQVDVDFRVSTVPQVSSLFVRGSDGQVGIGTGTPNEQLEVGGNVRVTGNYVNIRANGEKGWRLYDAAGNPGWYIIQDGANRLTFRASGPTRVAFEAGGRVGIGLTGPLGMLHVDQPSTTAAIPVLYLDQADVSEEMIEFNTTIGVGNAIEAVGGKTLTVTHFIKCTIPGPLTRYIPCGTIA